MDFKWWISGKKRCLPAAFVSPGAIFEFKFVNFEFRIVNLSFKMMNLCFVLKWWIWGAGGGAGAICTGFWGQVGTQALAHRSLDYQACGYFRSILGLWEGCFWETVPWGQHWRRQDLAALQLQVQVFVCIYMPAIDRFLSVAVYIHASDW